MFLWWSESAVHYEALIRLPYSSLKFVDLKSSVLGTLIELYYPNDEIVIGDQLISIKRETWFNFLKSGARTNAEETHEVFEFFLDRMAPEARPESSPSPCAEAPLPIDQQGFGEVSFRVDKDY